MRTLHVSASVRVEGSTSQPIPQHQPIQRLHPSPLPIPVPYCVQVLPAPGFCWCQATQALVHPHVVVEGGEFMEPLLQRRNVRDGELPQQGFEGSEQPFDTSVVPWAARIDALALYARELKSETHNRLVNMASLSVRTASGTPCSAQAAQNSASKVQVHLRVRTLIRSRAREPWSMMAKVECGLPSLVRAQLRSMPHSSLAGTTRGGCPFMPRRIEAMTSVFSRQRAWTQVLPTVIRWPSRRLKFWATERGVCRCTASRSTSANTHAGFLRDG